MNDKQKEKIDKLLSGIETNEKCLKYIIEEAQYMLEELEKNEQKQCVIDDLLNLFDVNETPFDKQIHKIYNFPPNIKKTIKGLKLLSFVFVNNGDDDYIDATILIDKFKVYTYSDYRRAGNKTGGQLNVKISLNKHILKFNNVYDFIPESYNTHKLNNIYKNIQSDKEQSKILNLMQEESGFDADQFEGFFKLLCCVPKIFNGLIY